MGIPDNYDRFVDHQRQQDDWLDKRPTCSNCDHKIQDEKVCYINDEFICLECLNEHFIFDTEDFME